MNTPAQTGVSCKLQAALRQDISGPTLTPVFAFQAATLDALPDGVPEELPIQCNGKSALLAVRTQRVLFNDQEISASKFEALCGKGDAKKWKCSIWQEDEDSEPVMVGCFFAALLGI